MCVVADACQLQGGVLVPVHLQESLCDEDGVGVMRPEGVDDGDLVGEVADVAFGVAELAPLGGA